MLCNNIKYTLLFALMSSSYLRVFFSFYYMHDPIWRLPRQFLELFLMKVFDVCLLVPAILFLLLLIYTSPRSRQKLSGAPAFVVFLQFITLASTGTHLPSVYHPCVFRYLSSFSLSPLRLQVLIFLQFITLASTGTYLPSVHHPCV